MSSKKPARRSRAAIHPLTPFVTSDLAERVGCSVHHLRNIRDGRKSPSIGLAKRLADATGIRMELFARGNAA